MMSSRACVQRPFADAVVRCGVYGSVAAVVLVFGAILGDVIQRGWGGLNIGFLTQGVADAGRAGGILPVLASTGTILLVCLAVSVPLGLGTGILLAEFSRRFARWSGFIRVSLDILAGVPSIVFGLFGNAFFGIVLGFGFSLLTGGLTLACMVLPLLIRAFEEGLRSVPDDQRQGGAALGLRQGKVVQHILLPAAIPGLLAGLILGIGRALAETAALLFTSGRVARMPESMLDSGRALTVHIWELAMNVPGGETNAYASALVLVVQIVAINGVARLLVERWRRTLEGTR